MSEARRTQAIQWFAAFAIPAVGGIVMGLGDSMVTRVLAAMAFAALAVGWLVGGRE